MQFILKMIGYILKHYSKENIWTGGYRTDMYCAKCGAELPKEARFCGRCGSIVLNDDSDNKNILLSKRKKYVVGAIVVIVVLTAVLFLLYSYNTIGRANRLAQNGKYEKALQLYEGILEKEPLNLEAFLGKLYVYSNMGNADDLRRTYQKALTIIRQMRPEETLGQTDIICQIYLYACKVYENNNEYKKSNLIEGTQYLGENMEYLDEYLERLREIVDELYVKQQREELIQACETLIRFEPEQVQYQNMAVQACQGLYKMLIMQKKFDEAEELLERYKNYMSEITVSYLRTLMDEKREKLPIKTERYDDDWFEASETEKSYDQRGQLVKLTWKWSGSKDVTTYAYDDFGNVIRRRNGDDIINYVYTYDLAGKILEMTSSDGYSYQYEYDDNGNCLKTTENYMGESYQYTRITLNEYNAGNNIIKSETTNEQGDFIVRYLYDYWDNGKLRQSTCELNNGLIDTFEYWNNGKMKSRTSNYGVNETYDEEGKMIESELYIDGKLDDYMKYQYDENGDVLSIERILYGSWNCTDTYQYEYDEDGRLVSKKVYRDSNILEWYEFEYYD